MRKTIILAAAVLAMAFSSIASTAQTVNNFTIKRGTNISHWLSHSNRRGAVLGRAGQQAARSVATAHASPELGREAPLAYHSGHAHHPIS